MMVVVAEVAATAGGVEAEEAVALASSSKP